MQHLQGGTEFLVVVVSVLQVASGLVRGAHIRALPATAFVVPVHPRGVSGRRRQVSVGSGDEKSPSGRSSEDKIRLWKSEAKVKRENPQWADTQVQYKWDQVMGNEQATSEYKLRMWKAKAAAVRNGGIFAPEDITDAPGHSGAGSHEQDTHGSETGLPSPGPPTSSPGRPKTGAYHLFCEHTRREYAKMGDPLTAMDLGVLWRLLSDEDKDVWLRKSEALAAEMAAKDAQEKEEAVKAAAAPRDSSQGDALVLCLAARSGIANSVLRLLDLGSDVNAVASRRLGRTALHEGAALGHADVVQLLLARGARTEILDEQGQTALDLARAKGHEHIAVLLTADQL